MDLPEDGEGLAWIAARAMGQLLLIPGIQETSILAASLGSLPAVQHLQARASEYAATLIEAQGSDDEHDSYKECEQDPELEDQRSYTAQLICQAAKEGLLEAMEWLQALCLPSLQPWLSLHPWPGDIRPMEAAAAHGHLSIMKVLQQRPNPAPYDWRVALAALPHWECLDWLRAQSRPGTHDWDCMVHHILEDLSRQGCLESIIRLHQHSGPAVKQHANCIDHFLASRCGMVVAAQHGHLLVVQWLRELDRDAPWPDGLCRAAAGSGNLSLISWLFSQDVPCRLNCVCTLAAATSGSLEMLQWLRAQQPPCAWHNCCTSAAAGQGNLPMLRWMRSQDQPAPWNSDMGVAAARSGSIPLLHWLQAQGAPCPIYNQCVSVAVMKGHLPMLQHLHSLGCTLDGTLYLRAAASSSGHILQWLQRQAVPVPIELPLNFKDWGGWELRFQGSMVMFLADIGFPLPAPLTRQLARTRKAFCTFHGLVRWTRAAVADPSKGIHRAFTRVSASTNGKHLLIRLSMLPQDLLNRIATLAELQHDLPYTAPQCPFAC